MFGIKQFVIRPFCGYQVYDVEVHREWLEWNGNKRSIRDYDSTEMLMCFKGLRSQTVRFRESCLKSDISNKIKLVEYEFF